MLLQTIGGLELLRRFLLRLLPAPGARTHISLLYCSYPPICSVVLGMLMRPKLACLLHAPALWYGLLCWLLLVITAVFPSALRPWIPGMPAADWWFNRGTPVALSSEVAQAWLVIVFTIALGMVAAWQRGNIFDAIVVVICATLACWMVYWLVFVLPHLLWPSPPSPFTAAREQSYYVEYSLLLLIVVAVVYVLPFGALLGAAGGVLGWSLHQLERRLRKSPLA